MGWQESIKGEMHFLFEDEALLMRLMTLEKARRGVPKNKLLFIGASDVAGQGWCSIRPTCTGYFFSGIGRGFRSTQ